MAVSGWREQKVVEIETVQAIADRLQSWAKLFGFFAGIPLVLFLAWLSILGYRKYSDFSAKVSSAQAEVGLKIDSAKSNVDVLQRDASTLRRNLNAANDTLASTAQLLPQVDKLTKRVDALQQVADVPELSRSTGERIGKRLLGFRTYLSDIGFVLPTTLPTIRFDDKATTTDVHTDVVDNSIVLPPAVNEHPEYAIGPYAYLLLGAIKPPGMTNQLESVLSHYYAASFSRIQPAGRDEDRELGYVVLWKVRERVGREKADRFAFAVLASAGLPVTELPSSDLMALFRYTAAKFDGGKLSQLVDESISNSSPPR